MKYLVTTMLIALSINAFTLLDANYIVCANSSLSQLVKCVNAEIDKGYKAQSGLHAVYEGNENKTYYFQALIKE